MVEKKDEYHHIGPRRAIDFVDQLKWNQTHGILLNSPEWMKSLEENMPFTITHDQNKEGYYINMRIDRTGEVHTVHYGIIHPDRKIGLFSNTEYIVDRTADIQYYNNGRTEPIPEDFVVTIIRPFEIGQMNFATAYIDPVSPIKPSSIPEVL